MGDRRALCSKAMKMTSLEKIGDALFKIPKGGEMNTDVLVFATPRLLEKMKKDATLNQITNVAKLPHVVPHACVMPDGHEGYGFPIGGVAAFDADHGIISPGGVGYDINCGVRLVSTPLTLDEVKGRMEELINALYLSVPAGLGSEGKLKLSKGQLDDVLSEGSKWAVEQGYGKQVDLERTEEYGCMKDADVGHVSSKAKKRGKKQLGTLGAGNHFLELQVVDKLFDPDVAKRFGLTEGQITIMIHCGSRGLGHQICADYVDEMLHYARRTGIALPDRELAYCPLHAQEGERYFSAMQCAVNFAFANRQIIMHWVREVFDDLFGVGEEMHLVYDVAHNIAKKERHLVDGQQKEVIVHRKGATRAFPAGRPELPAVYEDVGHPVLIPGSMGTASYVLVGQEAGMRLCFGSTCHGAGRVMSRKEAIKTQDPAVLLATLRSKGIYVKAVSQKVVAEESPAAYKDVDEVVKAMELNEVSRVVCKLRPVGVVKG